MKTLRCIDVLHAQGVCNYIRTQGHSALLFGRGVVTECRDEMVMETAAGYGLALVEPASPEEAVAFEKYLGI